MTAGLVLIFSVLPASAALPALTNSAGRSTLAPLLEQVTPAVVNIAVLSKTPAAQNPLLMDSFFRRFFNMPEEAAPVEPCSPAARRGLHAGDVIVAVNREAVHNADDLGRALDGAGRVIALNVIRGNARLFLVIQSRGGAGAAAARRSIGLPRSGAREPCRAAGGAWRRVRSIHAAPVGETCRHLRLGCVPIHQRVTNARAP